MSFFALPPEIRSMIYHDLLVHNGHITIVAVDRSLRQSSEPPILFVENPIRLHPAILGTSKQVHAEAISTLYSRNSFRFAPLEPSYDRGVDSVPAFLQRIGTQAAGSIRRVCIDFPTDSNLDRLDRLLVDELGNHDNSHFAEHLDLIEARVAGTPSLKCVKIHIRLVSRQRDAHSGGQQWANHKDSLFQQIHSRGWTANITRVPSVVTRRHNTLRIGSAGLHWHNELWLMVNGIEDLQKLEEVIWDLEMTRIRCIQRRHRVLSLIAVMKRSAAT
ncbi:hypothetical protein RB594_007204 [Gaeumannomyces avenae]